MNDVFVQPLIGVNQGAGQKRVCVSRGARALFPPMGGELRSFRLSVDVAIEATPSCIDHGVRAIDALGRKEVRNPIHCIRIGFHGFKECK